MGALTDNRKRCFLDLCVPLSSSASPVPSQSELSPGTPLLKKPKFTPPRLRLVSHRAKPSTPPPPQQQQEGVPVQPRPQSFSPPVPLRRPVHGPQRIVKVFGHRSPVAAEGSVAVLLVDGKEGDFEMGNIVTWSIRRTSLDALWSSRRRGEASVEHSGDHGFRDRSLEGLRLDEYKKLVKGAQGDRSVAAAERRFRETASGKTILPRSGASVVSDFAVLARGEDELPEPHTLNRKVEDARRLVKVDSVPLQEDVVEARRTPVYKDLLLSARKRDSKLSSLDFQVKLIETRISEFSKVSEVKPEEDLLGPFTPLTDEEENEVNLALQDPDKFRLRKDEVLVLHESSNIEITTEVIQCLNQGSWLNDEVINLYFELLKEREKREPTKFLKCHFFNTFFYKKLTSGRHSYDFKAVRRWTTQRKLGYGLIECDKICVPVHLEIHWCLAVIDVKNEELLYLDSLGGWDEHVLTVLARYFMDEVKDKSNKTINITPWKWGAVDNLPLQKNGWDCGMFMLKYADFISRGLSLCFEQDNMTYFRKRTAKEILRLRAE